MRRAPHAALLALCTTAVAIACGDVPTFPQGISFITPIVAPSTSVAYGDTLRDSLGRAAPLRVFAFGRDTGDTIRDVTVRYLLTTIDTGPGARTTIDRDGFLVADSVLRSLGIVAQVTDGTGNSPFRLQTNELRIDVVPRADSIARTTGTGIDGTLPIVAPLSVTVTGVGPTGRGVVPGIRVRYRIVETFPAVPLSGRYYLSDDAGNVLRPDSTVALDTTNAAGVASRSFVGLAAPGSGPNADSVLVHAEASSHANVPLRGSRVRFVVKLRR